MAAIIDAFTRIRKVEECTSPKDETPPVYLMDEIVIMVKESPEASCSVSDLLHKRLGNRSPVVKYKVCRVVRHLCLKGCTQFQRSMQRYASALRELSHYKGEQDPLKGDAPNQRVREAALETVEIMFNSIANPTASTPSSLQSRIQGFGSSEGGGGNSNEYRGGATLNPPSSASNTFSASSASGRFSGTSGSAVPSYGSSSSSRGGSNPAEGYSNGSGSVMPSRMVGFGSDSSYRPGQQPVAAGGRGGATGPGIGVGEMMSSLGSNVNSFIRSQFNAETSEHSGYLTAGSDAPGSLQSAPNTPPHYSYPGGTASQQRNNGSSQAASRNDFPAYNAADFESTANAALGSSASEEAVVDAMCTPGGMRVAPEAQDLRQFVESVSGMDGLRVAELLRAKMTGPSWQALLRALYALEAVLEQGMTQSCGEIAVMFQSDNSPVQQALHHTQPLVRERAMRVWPLLSNEDVPPESAATGQPGQAAPALGAHTVDLLGGLMDDIPFASSQQTGNGSMGDIFGGLALSPTPNQSPPIYTPQIQTASPYTLAPHPQTSNAQPSMQPQWQQAQQQQQQQQQPYFLPQGMQQQQQGMQHSMQPQQQQQHFAPTPVSLPTAAAPPASHTTPSPTSLRSSKPAALPLDDLFSDLTVGLQPRGNTISRPMGATLPNTSTANRVSPSGQTDPFSLLISTPPTSTTQPSYPSPHAQLPLQHQQQQYLSMGGAPAYQGITQNTPQYPASSYSDPGFQQGGGMQTVQAVNKLPGSNLNSGMYGGGDVGGGAYGISQTLQGGMAAGQQPGLYQQQPHVHTTSGSGVPPWQQAPMGAGSAMAPGMSGSGYATKGVSPAKDVDSTFDFVKDALR